MKYSKRRVAFSESDSDSEFVTCDKNKETHLKSRKRSKTVNTIRDASNLHVFDDESSHRGKVQLSLTDCLHRSGESRSSSHKSKKAITLDHYFSPKQEKPRRVEVSVDDFFSEPMKTKEPKITTPTGKRQNVPAQQSPLVSPDSIIPDTPNVYTPGLLVDSPVSGFSSPVSSKKPKTTRSPPFAASPGGGTSIGIVNSKSPLRKINSSDPMYTSPVKIADSPKIESVPETPETKSSQTPSASRKSFWQYQSREGPRALGSKSIPKGNSVCLKGKNFVITGVLESIEREDAVALIERCGGKVMKTLGKRADYVVVGRDPGQSKLVKAEALKTIHLDEDGLFSLIRELSHECSPKNNANVVENTPPKTPVIFPESPTVHKKAKHKTSSDCGLLTAKPVITSNQVKENIAPSSDWRTELIPASKQPDSGKVKLSAPSNQLWVDKYRPASRRSLIGQSGLSSPTNRLHAWLSSWHQHFANGAKAQAYSSAPPWASGSGDDGRWARAALLSGPPGVGKTSSAAVVCAELGFSTCELNASDCRSKRTLQEQINQTLSMCNLSQMAIGSATQLSSKQHVLLMDEVDGMAGNEDRGGIQEMINLIKSTHIPIICMCNDRQSAKVRSLSNYCFDLRFSRPRIDQIKAAILSIAFKEGVTVPSEVVNEIIQASNQDVRQVINNTQMWCTFGLADRQQLAVDANGARKHLKLSAFDVIRKVFSPDVSGPTGGPATFNDSLDLFFQDYSLVPLFVQENYLSVRPRLSELSVGKTLKLFAKAAEDIATADIVSRTIRSTGTGSWSLLPIQGVFSVLRPGRLLRGPLPGGPSGVNFPAWFGKNSHQGRISRCTAELANHISLAVGGRSGGSNMLLLDYICVLAERLTRPLKEGDTDSVLQTMVTYHLQREDLDSIVELATWPNRANRLQCIDSKVKGALTRAFNKSGHLLPYAVTAQTKSRTSKRVHGVDGEPGQEDTDGLFDADTDDDTEDVEHDAMVLHRKTSKSAGTSAGRVPSKSSKSQSTKVIRQPKERASDKRSGVRGRRKDTN